VSGTMLKSYILSRRHMCFAHVGDSTPMYGPIQKCKIHSKIYILKVLLISIEKVVVIQCKYMVIETECL
jgi:hypothetical protein